MAHPLGNATNDGWHQPGSDFNAQALAAATGDLDLYDATDVRTALCLCVA